MLARTHHAAAVAALALGLCALALVAFHPHDEASELLAKKKKAHPLAVKYFFDKGLTSKLGHKVMTQVLSDGLEVTDIQEGKGMEAKVGDIVKVEYTGKLTDGSVFDKGTISFPLGRHKVIKGWDQGLANMKAGGLRMLHIPPALAYGKKGNAKIPGDSALLFSVRLLHVTKAGVAKKQAKLGKKPFWEHKFKKGPKMHGKGKGFFHHNKANQQQAPEKTIFDLTHII